MLLFPVTFLLGRAHGFVDFMLLFLFDLPYLLTFEVKLTESPTGTFTWNEVRDTMAISHPHTKLRWRALSRFCCDLLARFAVVNCRYIICVGTSRSCPSWLAPLAP